MSQLPVPLVIFLPFLDYSVLFQRWVAEKEETRSHLTADVYCKVFCFLFLFCSACLPFHILSATDVISSNYNGCYAGGTHGMSSTVLGCFM